MSIWWCRTRSIVYSTRPICRAVAARPLRFVGLRVRALVQVVDVVAHVVVEHPGVGRDAGLQREHQVVDPIQDRRAEGVQVLVVVVDRRDEHADQPERDDAERRDPDRRQEEDERVEREHRVDVGDGSPVGAVLEEATARRPNIDRRSGQRRRTRSGGGPGRARRRCLGSLGNFTGLEIDRGAHRGRRLSVGHPSGGAFGGFDPGCDQTRREV